MVYVLSVLCALLSIVLIVTHARHERLQARLEGQAEGAMELAEQLKQEALMHEAMARDLAARIQDLQDVLADQRAHVQTIQQKSEVEAQQAFTKGEKHGRADALKRSKSVTHGFTSENFAPLFQDHDWNPKDFRHMGDPIDYLVVPGMSLVHQMGARANVDEVILLDIKTGKSQLNTVQRRIRDAIIYGRVRFATYNTDTGKLRKWPADPDPKQLELPW